jgi:hypothetical protein
MYKFAIDQNEFPEEEVYDESEALKRKGKW